MLSFLVWVFEVGVVVLAFVVWVVWVGGWGVIGFVGLGCGVSVGGEDGEGPLGFFVQGGCGLVCIGFGWGVVVGLLEFVGIASDFDLAVSVFIEFVKGEVPVLGGFLSEGCGLVLGCLSEGGVGWVWGGVAVCNEVFFEM